MLVSCTVLLIWGWNRKQAEKFSGKNCLIWLMKQLGLASFFFCLIVVNVILACCFSVFWCDIFMMSVSVLAFRLPFLINMSWVSWGCLWLCCDRRLLRSCMSESARSSGRTTLMKSSTLNSCIKSDTTSVTLSSLCCLSVCLWCCALWLNNTSYSNRVWTDE